MWDDVAAGCPAQPIDKLLQRQALGGQCVRFVVCDYFRSVFYGKSETPVCPHLLRNPRRNQGRPQIKDDGLYAADRLWTIRFAGRCPKGYLKAQLQ